MGIFVISDTHFFDEDIYLYDGKARYGCFSSLEEMHDVIKTRWNSIVEKSDIVYHLGDVSKLHNLKAIDLLNSLNGKKFLVPGNHCNIAFWARSGCFVDIASWFKMLEQQVILSHFPLQRNAYDSYGESWFNVHGHLHGYKQEKLVNSVDVSCECVGYSPKSLEDIISEFRS